VLLVGAAVGNDGRSFVFATFRLRSAPVCRSPARTKWRVEARCSRPHLRGIVIRRETA